VTFTLQEMCGEGAILVAHARVRADFIDKAMALDVYAKLGKLCASHLLRISMFWIKKREEKNEKTHLYGSTSVRTNTQTRPCARSRHQVRFITHQHVCSVEIKWLDTVTVLAEKHVKGSNRSAACHIHAMCHVL
jgi:hypothetical protein